MQRRKRVREKPKEVKAKEAEEAAAAKAAKRARIADAQARVDAEQKAAAERRAKGPADPLEAAFADLASEDRAKRLDAIFALGSAFEGGAAPGAEPSPEEKARVDRVVEKLEAILATRVKGANWERKRAKRALKRIRSAGDDAGDDDEEGEGAEG